MPQTIQVSGRHIGPGCPVFVIAEIGTNHNRDFGKARELVDAACEAGVDAVKFQLYEASDIVSKSITAKDYGLDGLYGEQSAHEVFDAVFRTPRDWFPELSDYASSRGLATLATAHSLSGARFIAKCGMGAVKIASMDCNNLPLVAGVARESGLPVLISTGMATLSEVDQLVAALDADGARYCILHCVANYPPQPSEMHLGNISYFAERYGVPIGFSDHAITGIGTIAAVAKGARVVEKHITLDRNDEGPDHCFATQPEEFRDLVRAIRECEQMLTEGFVPPSERELDKRAVYRRSVVAARSIAAGRKIVPEDIQITRPGIGIPPDEYEKVIGCTALQNIEPQVPLLWSMLDSGEA